MSKYKNALFYSVGKKFIMAITGLGLAIFLITHLAGNLLALLPDNGVTYNEYSAALTANKLTLILEIILFAGFLFHIIDGILLTIENRKARPVGYAVSKASANSSWTSRNMGITGSIIFIFLIIHLKTFFFPHRFDTTGEHNLYLSLVDAFTNPWYSGFYVLAMILLGLHLHHGFQSAFQSFGLNHKKYTPFIKKLSVIFAFIMAVGFGIIPLFFLFGLHQ